MTAVQCLITAAAILLGTLATRFAPFVLLPKNRPVPRLVEYLGGTLPYAAMGLLVVYCLKNVDFSHSPFGLPEAVSVILVGVLHHWRHNILLSIGGGTAVYMLLVQLAVPVLM